MLAAVRTCLTNYVTFSGRAGRREYWWFVLFVVAGVVVLSLFDQALFGTPAGEGDTAAGPLASVFQVATFVPLLAAGWRRMHDTGRTGWLLLLPLAMSAAIAVGALLGVAAFAGAQEAGLGEETLRTGALGAFVIGQIVAGLVWLVTVGLMIYWLTRRGEAGANRFGAEPAR